MNEAYARIQRHPRALLVVLFLVVLTGALSFVARVVVGFEGSSEARSLAVVDGVITYVVNLLTVVLFWIALENMKRIDREAKRIQAFGDTLYRQRLK